jgi:hypothetical protein
MWHRALGISRISAQFGAMPETTSQNGYRRGGLIAGDLQRPAQTKLGYTPEMPEQILLLRGQTQENCLSSESLGIVIGTTLKML